MKIVSVKFYRYRLPLSKTIMVGGRELDFRAGILIRLEDENGLIAFGDVAPLPGLSKIGLDKIEKLLNPITEELLRIKFSDFYSYLAKKYPRSLSFAIDSAYKSLSAKAKGMPLYKFMDNAANDILSANALFLSSELNDEQKINFIKEKRYKIVKVKINSKTLKKDAENILRMNRIFAGNVKFRIDANRSLLLNNAVEFAKKIMDVPIDYFEEPLRHSEQLEQFYKLSGLKYAIDESICENTDLPTYLNNTEGLKTLVIKPQIYGTWNKVLTIIANYKKLNDDLNVTVSDIFSSGVGLGALIQFAASLKQKDMATGVDTYSYLKSDILKKRYELSNSIIDVNNVWELSQDVDYQKINEYSLSKIKKSFR